jgi:hypothetical protein
MVGTNYLAILLPLGGRSTGQISDNYQNLFAPAGYAFSIWGLIHTLLGIFTVYQLWREKDELVEKVNKIFIVNALLNASWIFAWHHDLIWLSVIIMGGLLVTLIKIADIFRGRALTPKETWLVRLPFSVYFGWITVATIANVTVFLVYIGWNRFGLPEVFLDSHITLVWCTDWFMADASRPLYPLRPCAYLGIYRNSFQRYFRERIWRKISRYYMDSGSVSFGVFRARTICKH